MKALLEFWAHKTREQGEREYLIESTCGVPSVDQQEYFSLFHTTYSFFLFILWCHSNGIGHYWNFVHACHDNNDDDGADGCIVEKKNKNTEG